MCKAPLARGNAVAVKGGWSGESRDLTLPLQRGNARDVARKQTHHELEGPVKFGLLLTYVQ